MKITQAKGYKKPLYAIGIAAAITALSVTGCTDPGKIDYAGDVATCTTETTEVRLAGETADTDPTEIELDGDIAIPESTRATEAPLITAGIVSQTIDSNE